MAGKSTDRKGKAKNGNPEAGDNLAVFTLPDSLPPSEIEFPILRKGTKKVSWNEILEESEKKFKEIEEYVQSQQEPIIKSPFLSIMRDTETEEDYIKNEVFGQLLPALEEALNKAKIWEALVQQKCFFNGIDYLAQVLWNNNPRYPERKAYNLHLFNMPWVREYLTENPRPYYPKSWLWPEEYAATLIQKTIRQYFVQREDEVQEMREFWRKLEVERHVSDMQTNPFLAKKFAKEHCIHKE